MSGCVLCILQVHKCHSVTLHLLNCAHIHVLLLEVTRGAWSGEVGCWFTCSLMLDPASEQWTITGWRGKKSPSFKMQLYLPPPNPSLCASPHFDFPLQPESFKGNIIMHNIKIVFPFASLPKFLIFPVTETFPSWESPRPFSCRLSLFFLFFI